MGMFVYIFLAPSSFVLDHAPKCYRIAHGLNPCWCCGTLRGLIAAKEFDFEASWRLNPFSLILLSVLVINAFVYFYDYFAKKYLIIK
jgi:hypothetical protein